MAELFCAVPMMPRSYHVRRIGKETADTFTLELAGENENGTLSFDPGQFNMVYVFGVGEVPISISGDPSSVTTVVHTTRAVGAVTKAMRKLKRGDVVGVRGPFGTPWPLREAEGNDVVIVAGGIGIAPLRPCLFSILAQREKYAKVVLLYGTRTPQDILFRKELEQWRSRFDLEVHVTVDRAQRPWMGNVGVVTALIGKASFDPLNCIAMVCGPEVMMRFTVHELQKRGIAEDHIYLSLERNMKCAIGLCGHCQFGPYFVCKDGPVFSYPQIKNMFAKWEI